MQIGPNPSGTSYSKVPKEAFVPADEIAVPSKFPFPKLSPIEELDPPVLHINKNSNSLVVESWVDVNPGYAPVDGTPVPLPLFP